MDEEMMVISPEKFVDVTNQAYREGLKDPATKTGVFVQYNGLFVDNDRVNDLGKKVRREILRNAAARTYDID